MTPNKQPVVFIMGPTASGKTNLAVHLNQSDQFEIISVDSAMIYRDMNIGTAKPDDKTLTLAHHHLINIRNPNETYSVSEFCQDAHDLIDEIHQRKKIPLLVGGTIMYFHSLEYGLSQLPSANNEVRTRLTEQAEQVGWPKLHQELANCDPVSASKIHPNDAQRIQRALEVYELTGKAMSDFQKTKSLIANNFSYLKIGLFPEDRAKLHALIEKRFDQMLADGVLDELIQLKQSWPLQANLPSMRCIGYRQLWNYLEKKCSYNEMRNQAIAATRQFAKRQLTWMRHYPDTQLIDPFKYNTEELAEKIISQLPSMSC